MVLEEFHLREAITRQTRPPPRTSTPTPEPLSAALVVVGAAALNPFHHRSLSGDDTLKLL